MILDLLANASLYRGLSARLVAALEFLEATDLVALPLGKTVIDGERLFALVQEYQPKPASVLKYEAHRRYWDVQYVVSGLERMGWNTLSRMTVNQPHDVERDVAFFTGSGDTFLVAAGTFTIFGPHDVHMPGIEPGGVAASTVRKIVVKVDVSGT